MNIPTAHQEFYTSGQSDISYRLDKRNAFLMTYGYYHSYTTPSFYNRAFNQLLSRQFAFEYAYKRGGTRINAAIYTKSESGKQLADPSFTLDTTNTFGIEFTLQQSFYKYFKFDISNAFIRQRIRIGDETYKGAKNFDYLVKASVAYNNPHLFSLAVVYMGRPGALYTPIVYPSSDDRTALDKPAFSSDLYSAQYGSYNRLDISLSRYFSFRKQALIPFISINNLLNTKNDREIVYNADYSKSRFNPYQLRTLYFGLIWRLTY